jgi:hypothetical protein
MRFMYRLPAKSIEKSTMIMTVTISVNPNPFSDLIEIEIDYEGISGVDYVISLVDMNGMIKTMAGVAVENGLNTFTMDNVDNLSAGSYALTIKNTDGENIFQRRLTKA